MTNELSKRWWSGCALLVAMVASLGAQTSGPSVTLLKSGLHSVRPSDQFVATLAQTNTKAAPAEVRIEFRDAAEVRRGFAKGVLVPGRPVRLRVQVQGTGLQQLRAIVLYANSELSAPAVTLERIETNSLTIYNQPPCYPWGGGGVQAHCDGWGVTRLTLGGPMPGDTADVD